MAEHKLTLGYWGIRGAGQPIRNLLAYLNIQYEDKQYVDRPSWFEVDKPALKSDFPNLPYLIDGEKVITESEAILVYLAYKSGRVDLLGTSLDEKIELTQVKGVFGDLRKAAFESLFNKEADALKGLEEKAVPKLKLLANHLGKNDFMIGKLSIVDFAIGELLNWLAIQDVDFVKSTGLNEYLDRVNSLTGLKEYLSSGKAPKVFMPPEYVNPKIKV